jgi:aquaporin PIP
MITTLAFAIGDLSGGHMNPAVTVSMLATKNISPIRGCLYIVSQCVGGIIGGGMVKLAVGKDHYVSGIGKAPFVTAGGAFVLEFMGTLVLIFTVFHVAIWAANVKEHLTSSNTQALAPLPIGFAVLVVHLAIGPLTGCGINPARVLGAVVWQEKEPFPGHHWVYYIGPFAASIVGPLVYFVLYGTVHPNDHSMKASSKQIEPIPAATEN